MPVTIDYYMTSISPFTYLGHQTFRAIAHKHGAEVRVKPVNLGRVFENSGALPLAQRPTVRQRYRLVELQRIADYRGMPLHTKPRYWPVDPGLAEHTIIALVEAGHDPLSYMDRVLASVWANEEDIADEAILAAHLRSEGFDADAVLEQARMSETAEIRARNSEEAIAADVVGVPAFVLKGEPFWGQDRLEYLDQALASGRKPFSP
ncbi:2-hydroxychromene-2-carboxylate isomerase [Chelativorans sp.]|uniref:2-hydroxychromene-2-carboxylate isomerase n=1 Tax=Chelativorans sp. TaxID=2203393 RepID=UPI0028122D3F|nr:2-hydroxychromene-2-carboxylate isomerase [Chelativorans sp.]